MRHVAHLFSSFAVEAGPYFGLSRSGRIGDAVFIKLFNSHFRSLGCSQFGYFLTFLTFILRKRRIDIAMVEIIAFAAIEECWTAFYQGSALLCFAYPNLLITSYTFIILYSRNLLFF